MTQKTDILRFIDKNDPNVGMALKRQYLVARKG